MNCPPEMRLAVPADIEAVAVMSARVQADLVARGSLQQFGPLPFEVITAHVAARTAHVIDRDGLTVASVFVERDDAPVTPQLERIFDNLQVRQSSAPRWWLQKLMVAPEHRGKGLGIALLDGVKQHITTNGGGLLVLDCWAGNTKLRRFYTQAGFRFHGVYVEERSEVAAFIWEPPG